MYLIHQEAMVWLGNTMVTLQRRSLLRQEVGGYNSSNPTDKHHNRFIYLNNSLLSQMSGFYDIYNNTI